VYDFPQVQAALARLNPNNPLVVSALSFIIAVFERLMVFLN